jgi:MazG family protein
MPTRHRRASTARRRPGSPARTARAAAARFRTLVALMQRLRGPRGCPWDRAQTYASLRPFLLEETYEVLDAIDRGDRDALAREIGDLLFEGVFLAQIAADERAFTIVDALEAIAEKLVRRHPHVFGSARGAAGATRPRRRARGRRLETPEQVVEQWEAIKAREQAATGGERGLLAGIPKSLPALLRAHEIGTRAAAVGFDWARAEDVVAKIEEEVAELRRALGREPRARIEEEAGDLLFAIANLCRKLGVEPESALRRANDKFTERFAALERRLARRGRAVHEATLDELEAEWQALKES